jgi:1,4-alpha-glucan branching enzyme
MERTWYGYDLGFPARGFWAEAFNSDVYDHWVNPWAARNGAGIRADGKPLNGFTTSGSIVIPANSVIVFVRSYGPRTELSGRLAPWSG